MCNRTITSLTMAVAVLANFPAHVTAEEIEAIEEIVVTATRTERAVDTLGSAVTVLGEQQVERSGARLVMELLEQVPGLYAYQAGGPGGATNLRIRGADSDHTLVLIDGVRVNDVGSAQGDFDFSSLLTTGIERIEVVRGPQSAVWGSDAIGGVINIITKRGEAGLQGAVEAEAGSYNTRRLGGSLRGGGDAGSFALSANALTTDGFSRVAERLGATEDDGSDSWTLTGRGDYRYSERWATEAAFHASSVDAESDPSIFGAVDGEAGADKSVYSGRLTQRFDPESFDNTGHDFTLFAQRTQREFFDATAAVPRSDCDGSSAGFEYQGTADFEQVSVLAGLRYQRDSAEHTRSGPGTVIEQFDADFDTGSVFAQAEFAGSGGFNATVGSRLDDFEVGGAHVTWRIAGSYLRAGSGTRLRASYGTGAKAPTLYQSFFDGPEPIFGSILIGNQELEVEESRGYDLAVEQRLFDEKLMLSAGYYRQDIENLIEFEIDFATFTSTYVNIAEVETSGWELEARWQPADSLGLSATYTTTEARDQSNGLDLARTPEAQGSLRVDFGTTESLYLGAQLVYVGEQFNRSRERDPLDSWVRVDLDGTWQASDALQLFARVENLFDEDYEVVQNAGVAGRSGYLGLRYRW